MPHQRRGSRPAAGSCPRPGRITTLTVGPTGYGVRWDGGYEAGDEISQYYDNLVGKLVVWGAGPRRRPSPACSGRSRRCAIEGVATTIPADLAILAHPDFAAARRTRPSGSRTTLDLTGVARRSRRQPPAEDDEAEPKVDRDVDVEVNGKRFAVKMWVPESAAGAAAAGSGAAQGEAASARAGGAAGGCGAGSGPGRRPDAGHDREGARGGGRRRSRPVRPSACSRR